MDYFYPPVYALSTQLTLVDISYKFHQLCHTVSEGPNWNNLY